MLCHQQTCELAAAAANALCADLPGAAPHIPQAQLHASRGTTTCALLAFSVPCRRHLLKLTLHDWPDADCLRILAAVRAAQAAAGGPKAGGRLLVVDLVLPDGGPLGLCAASSDLQVR